MVRQDASCCSVWGTRQAEQASWRPARSSREAEETQVGLKIASVTRCPSRDGESGRKRRHCNSPDHSRVASICHSRTPHVCCRISCRSTTSKCMKSVWCLDIGQAPGDDRWYHMVRRLSARNSFSFAFPPATSDICDYQHDAQVPSTFARRKARQGAGRACPGEYTRPTRSHLLIRRPYALSLRHRPRAGISFVPPRSARSDLSR